MQHIIFGFYILLFSTGFMGLAALVFLRMRTKEPLLGRFIAFQTLFLLGLGIVGSYFYLGNLANKTPALGIDPRSILGLAFGIASSLVNGAIYVLALGILIKLEPAGRGKSGISTVAKGLAALVVAQTLFSAALAIARASGSSLCEEILSSQEWHLGGYILTGLAIAAFGFATLRASAEEVRPPIRYILKGYSICALAFAPLGLLEWALNEAGIQPWKPLSLDYLFYLGWNLVAVAAFARSLAHKESVGLLLTDLGLTDRESQMALMIARGLANKEMAAELGISPATVRTHIYNLYRKVGAQSRVELINKLRGNLNP